MYKVKEMESKVTNGSKVRNGPRTPVGIRSVRKF